jgi:hypothetical protein
VIVVYLRCDPTSIGMTSADGTVVYRALKCIQHTISGTTAPPAHPQWTALLSEYASDDEAPSSDDHVTDDETDAAMLGVPAAPPEYLAGDTCEHLDEALGAAHTEDVPATDPAVAAGAQLPEAAELESALGQIMDDHAEAAHLSGAQICSRASHAHPSHACSSHVMPSARQAQCWETILEVFPDHVAVRSHTPGVTPESAKVMVPPMQGVRIQRDPVNMRYRAFHPHAVQVGEPHGSISFYWVSNSEEQSLRSCIAWLWSVHGRAALGV